jgi:hypothetical protein
VCIEKEKTFEAKWKKMMIGWADNQVPTFGFTQHLKRARCESEGKSKMMLENEWLCNIF